VLKQFLPDDPAVLPEELLARHIFSVSVKRVRRRLAAALDPRATGIDPRLGVNCIVESIMDAEQIEAEIVALGRRSTPVQIVHAKPLSHELSCYKDAADCPPAPVNRTLVTGLSMALFGPSRRSGSEERVLKSNRRRAGATAISRRRPACALCRPWEFCRCSRS
jgi:hypothetical protein